MARPLKFNNLEELEKRISDYFASTPREEWTITGLAIALDTCRQTLLNYEEKDIFLDTIKRAKLFVENSYEIDLKKHGRTGTIFALKNFDWKDQTQTDITSGNKPIPILQINAVSKNNSNKKDIRPDEKDKDSTGGNISQ